MTAPLWSIPAIRIKGHLGLLVSTDEPEEPTDGVFERICLCECPTCQRHDHCGDTDARCVVPNRPRK